MEDGSNNDDDGESRAGGDGALNGAAHSTWRSWVW